jgi:hypothetical protein
MALVTEHGVVGILQDGRVIAYGKNWEVVAPGQGISIAFLVRVPDLRQVDQVIHIQFNTDPVCDPGTAVNKSISGNVVGMTIVGLAVGTTLEVTVVAVG